MFAAPIQQLIDTFSRLPGVGPKTAERFVLFLLKSGRGEVGRLQQALSELLQSVRSCEVCQNFAATSPCEICSDSRRNQSIICVVAEPTDVAAMEKSGFRGVYHVLRGTLRPLDGVGPEQIKSAELFARVRATENLQEIILALDPTIEGETTTQYITQELTGSPVIISRLATGLPAGSLVEYADDLTLAQALSGRRCLNLPKK